MARLTPLITRSRRRPNRFSIFVFFSFFLFMKDFVSFRVKSSVLSFVHVRQNCEPSYVSSLLPSRAHLLWSGHFASIYSGSSFSSEISRRPFLYLLLQDVSDVGSVCGDSLSDCNMISILLMIWNHITCTSLNMRGAYRNYLVTAKLSRMMKFILYPPNSLMINHASSRPQQT